MTTTFRIQAILEALQKVTSKQENFVPLHEPSFQGNEWLYVKECIDTGWVSSVGKYVNKFEEMLADYTGVKHAIAVVNGTAAVHVCLKLAGVEANDEVLVPALTFIASANAISYCGAIPHFVDSSYETLGLDPVKLDHYLMEISVQRKDGCYNKITGRRIKAVLPMHTFGHPVDMDALLEICDRYKIELVEDAAESLGSYYKGRHTGNWGKLAAVSFNGNKVVTTGGGGAILTNNDELGKMAKHITTTAKKPHPWAFDHDHIGFNYRMPNLNAALGCAQLEMLSKFIEQKRTLANMYANAFLRVDGVKLFMEPSFAKSNYWLQVLILEEQFASEKEKLLKAANETGFMTRPVWKPLHEISMYQNCPKMNLDVVESLARRIINIPSSPGLVR
ncbi:LegC family aminotransferase [Brevibacillus sp. DP1.3A]|uniref:LegC family aminotransferase n=1 Tax=Brevibacillus sp. DP1.3A TaxID=2738867 RepID=UPI00156AC542|nr:LegC family aminotransferase [Brevibacillus sp. DP1.3A]UED75570.1 LegC family aminotransferase [Brevibacillus sp. DP1.3A]